MNSTNTKALKSIAYVGLSVIIIFIATAISFLFRHMNFPETNIVIIYILAVLLTACFTNGFAYGIASSVISTLVFNYFFTAPYFTLSVDDPSYLITFVIMTITALTASTLTSRVKKSAMEAKERENETKALFSLINHLTDADSIHSIAEISANTMGKLLGCDVGCICFDENGQPEPTFVQFSNEKIVHRQTQNSNEIIHNISQLKSEHFEDTEFYNYPIYGKENCLGLIRIPSQSAEFLTDAQRKLLHSMIESTSLAMDRFYSEYQRVKLHEQTVQERYRGNLLRSISHDLRTPLSGIMGTSEMLMDMTEKEDLRYSMAEGIYKDADWLHSLVENILSLTKLQDGKIAIHKEPEAIEEIIGGAINHIQSRSPSFDISVKIPDEVMIVPVDAKLIEQVLINLLDNAIKHSANYKEINISASYDDKHEYAVIKVSDNGDGISDNDLPNIFQAFFTTSLKHSDAKKGIGLGLPICEAIITAHGGIISAENNAEKSGAVFTFTLPLEDNI